MTLLFFVPAARRLGYMQELTIDRIMSAHASVIGHPGGDTRIISEANLHQLVFRANLEPDPIRRTALVLYSLAAYPAFREGNIATAVILAAEILHGEGYVLDPGDARELARLAEEVEGFTADLPDIQGWLSKHARKGS